MVSNCGLQYTTSENMDLVTCLASNLSCSRAQVPGKWT